MFHFKSASFFNNSGKREVPIDRQAARRQSQRDDDDYDDDDSFYGIKI